VKDDWSSWFPFTSEISENAIELPWILSKGNGIKKVHFQFATSNGLTRTIQIEVIADYDYLPYTIYFYKPTNQIPQESEIEDVFSEDNRCKFYEYLPVAALKSAETDGEQPDSSYVHIEIVPDIPVTGSVTFDFIQQGGSDKFNLPTIFIQEKKCFRGWITINKEDKGYFKDGLAKIIVHFKDDYSDPLSVSSSYQDKTEIYIKDKFNSMVSGGLSSTNVLTDVFFYLDADMVAGISPC
jgi:hypothetical protein